MPRLGISTFFCAIACPLCGGDEYSVLSHSRYPQNQTAEQLQQAFRASIDDKLIDQLVRCLGCELDNHQGILSAGLFPDESFDVITLWDVIEHVTQPADLLNSIHRLLKRDGLLLVNYPDFGSWMARLLGQRWPFLLSVHLLYYTRTTITRQLQKAGFTPLRIRPHFQTLRLGYILKRMEPYIGITRPIRSTVEWAHLGDLPVTYNMGQTLVVARKSI